MSNEIRLDHTTAGLTTYAQLWNVAGQVLTVSGLTFGAYATASIAGYKIALTQAGTASAYYQANMPAVPAGVYDVVYFEQAGGSPAETDAKVGSERVYWSGAVIDRMASPTNITAASGITVSTNNDKTGYSLSAAAVQSIWDAATSALTTVGSIGKWILDKLDVVLSTRASATALTNAQADLTELLGRLSLSRAGYLDNLNVGGPVAAQADISALNQSASRRIILTSVLQFERPESGNATFTVEARTYDGDGAAVDADSTPTLTATGSISGSLAANLGSATNPATGVYRWAYTVASDAVVEQIRFDVSAVISSSTFTLPLYSQVVDTVALPFNSTDRANLTAIANKLPSRGYLAGATASTGAIVPADLGLASANLDDQFNDLPTAGENAAAVRAELDTELGRIDAAISTRATNAGVAAQVTADHGAGSYVRNTEPLDATATQNAAALAVAGFDPPTRTEATADKDEILAAIAELDTGAGSGARTVTVTVNDGTNPIEGAKVRFTSGVQSYLQETGVNGVAVFSLDDATWSVAITKPLYSFTPTSLVVDGPESPTYSMVGQALPAPETDLQTTAFLYTYDANGAIAGGVSVAFVLAASDGTAGRGYDSTTVTATSDENGLLTVALLKNTKYRAGIGSSPQKQFTTGSDDSFAIPEIVGIPDAEE